MLKIWFDVILKKMYISSASSTSIRKRQAGIRSISIWFFCFCGGKVSKFKSIYVSIYLKIFMYCVVKWSAYTVCHFCPLCKIILAHASRVIFVLHNTFDFECEKSDCICFIKYRAYVSNKNIPCKEIKY